VPGVTLGRRKLSAAAAGAGNVTDPPPPVFLYDFVVDAAGTYWYHDHSQQLTYIDGLRGALVVADPWSPAVPQFPRGVNSPTVFLSDQYHAGASALEQQYVNSENSEGVEPVPKSLSINGLAGVRTPWCGGGGNQPPCRSAVINAAPLGSCASPNTELVFVSGAAFAFVRIHLETGNVSVRATLLTVDGITLATPRPVFLKAAAPLELQPGQRYRVALCSDDPAAASAKPARIVIRAPLQQFGTAGKRSRRRGRKREKIQPPLSFLAQRQRLSSFRCYRTKKNTQEPAPTASASTARPAGPTPSPTARSSTRRRPSSTSGGPTRRRRSTATSCRSRARCRCRSTGRRSSRWCSPRSRRS